MIGLLTKDSLKDVSVMRSAFTCDEGRNESRVCGRLRALPVMQDSKKKSSVMRWKFTCDENRNERRDYVTPVMKDAMKGRL